MFSYFNNKVVVVTGASKGIGRSLVRFLLSGGGRVAGLARSAKLLEELANEARSSKGQFIPVVCDISDPGSIASSVKSIIAKFGEIDILINNAGLGWTGPSLEMTVEDQTKCFDVNFFGAVNCIRHIAPIMIKRGHGVIVNVTSVAAKCSIPTYSFYSAAKAALSAYSQALRMELAPAGVDVLTIYPGGTDTDFKKDQSCSADYRPDEIRSKQMSPDFVAQTILLSIISKKAETLIGIPARIIVLLKFLSLPLLEHVMTKQFKISNWYKKKSGNAKTDINYVDANIKSGVDLLGVEKTCQYHSDPEFISPSSILPKGLQPSLYYALYPYLLATAYGGNINPDQAFGNPVSKTRDPVFIRRKPLHLTEQSKNIVKTLLSPVIPLGRIKTLPEIETIDGTYPFDLGGEGTTCPAAIRSFFPFWAYSQLKNEDNATNEAWKITCPDHLKNLTFGTGNPDESFFESICYFGDKAKIKTTSPCTSCSCDASDGQDSQSLPESLDEIMKKLGFPCPTLLNVMYGYYLTLVKGGELAFYSKTFDAAIAQCPNPRSRVVVEICRKKETIEFTVVDVIGSTCPRSIKKSDTFFLPRSDEKNGFCLDAFNSLFLSCGLAELSKEPLNVGCVVHSCNAAWEVSHGQEGI